MGARAGARAENRLEPRSARGRLGISLSSCGVRVCLCDLCSWATSLTARWPQGSQTVYMAADIFWREASETEATLPFVI